jgi:hypothetical protein
LRRKINTARPVLRNPPLLGQVSQKLRPAFAAAPPGCNFKGAGESWKRVAEEVQNRPRSPRGIFWCHMKKLDLLIILAYI